MKHRIAILGCGGMARNHARDLQTVDRFELVAAADLLEPPREAMRKVAPTVKLYGDAAELLAREKPEMVIVATRAPAHAALSIMAMQAGTHVLCEKPMTVTVAQADQMLAVAKETGRLLLVNHQFRVNPRAQAALKLVREGAIGHVRSMLCAAKGRHGGWELVESGTHLFDLALLFGGKAQWITGQMLTGDRLATEADIIDGSAVGGVTSGPIVGERAFVSVGFDGGAVLRGEFFDVPSRNFLHVAGTKGLLHVPLGVAEADPWIYPRAFVDPNDTDGWKKVPVEWGAWGKQHNVYAYDLWARWAELPAGSVGPMAVDGRQPMDATAGRDVMEIIHGAFESHFRGGARVPLPLANREHPLVPRDPRNPRNPR